MRAYIDETGIHIPEYPEILADLQASFREIYGPDLYLEPDSQDGALCAVFALRLLDCYALAASVYHSFAPSTAQGAGLDSVVGVNGIRRRASSRSQAELLLTGTPGASIISGQAQDQAGNKWLLPSLAVIPASGEIAVSAQAAEEGDIRAAAGEINQIATPQRGWQSVSNQDPALPGAPVETDSQLRRRQRRSVSLPAKSIFESTVAAVAELTGVTHCRGYENDADAPDADGIPGHSICIVAAGGDAQEIARVLDRKKGPGCGTYGNQAVSVTDINGLPKLIRFSRPTDAPCRISVTLQALEGYRAETESAVKAAILEYCAGLDIGDNILLSRLYMCIYGIASRGAWSPLVPALRAEAAEAAFVSSFDVTAILAGRADGPMNQANLAIAFDELTRLGQEDVIVETLPYA